MFFFEKLVVDTFAKNRVLMFSTSTYATISALVGTPPDPTDVATVIFVIYDCQGRLASDVSITPSTGNDFHVIPIDDEMNPRLDRSTTTEGGIAVVVNVVPVAQTFTFADEKRNRTVGDAVMYTQAGANNYMHWYPSHSAFVKQQHENGNPNAQ